jgi:hypothetical protein
MPALEILTGIATAPGAVLTNLVMSAGLTNTVRNCPEEDAPQLLNAWTDSQAAGTFQIRSPKLHDNVRGISLATTIGAQGPLLPFGCPQRLYPQDALTLALSGSAVAGDIETGCLLIYYPNLPGVNARFITPEQFASRAIATMGQFNTIATGVTGNFTGSEAINVEFDNWKANEDYALVGYNVDVDCAAVRWIGSDSGNLGVGGPGLSTQHWLTNTWFKRLSDHFGLPLIPVFNAANKSAILLDAAQDENGVDVVVNSLFVQLTPE